MFHCDCTNQYFLAPKLKGRPRKRKPRQTTGVGSPAESEASSESSTSTSMSISAPKVKHFVLEVTSFELDTMRFLYFSDANILTSLHFLYYRYHEMG